MEVFIVWIVLSIIAGVLASNKGRSGFGYFVLSILLSPLVGIIAAAVAKPNVAKVEETQLVSGDSKRCPYCAELVKKQAIVCRFCKRNLATDGSSVSTGASASDETLTHDELMARYGISNDGSHYIYSDSRFSKLEQAVAYARELNEEQ